MTKINSVKKPLFKEPWGYAECFLFAFQLLLLGLILEVFLPNIGFLDIHFPLNFITGIFFILFLIFIYIKSKNKLSLRWLSSIPAAVSAITFFSLLALVMGFIPQDDSRASDLVLKLGLTHLKDSWLFVISEVYLMTSLGLVILRRCIPLNKKNVGFLLNHFGLWITLYAATLGSGDLLRLRLKLIEGQDFKNIAVDDKLNLYQLPFSTKLINFDIEEYPPKLALINSQTGEIDPSVKNNLELIDEKQSLQYKNWRIEILKLLKSAIPHENDYIDSNKQGAGQAVLLKITNQNNYKIDTGWVFTGSHKFQSRYLKIDSIYSFAVTVPEPKVYSSKIEIIDYKGKRDTAIILVNKPYSKYGYKLYQMSYEQAMGKWSVISILEVIRDPWLIIVYIGIAMLLAGAVYIFWIGSEKK